MYQCPQCHGDVQDQETKCPGCECNLTSLARLLEVPDVLFNKALAALKGGDLTTAVNAAGAGLNQRIRDPGLWMILGHAAVRLSAFDLARNCFQMVQVMKRDYEPAQHALNVVRQLQHSGES